MSSLGLSATSKASIFKAPSCAGTPKQPEGYQQTSKPVVSRAILHRTVCYAPFGCGTPKGLPVHGTLVEEGRRYRCGLSTESAYRTPSKALLSLNTQFEPSRKLQKLRGLNLPTFSRGAAAPAPAPPVVKAPGPASAGKGKGGGGRSESRAISGRHNQRPLEFAERACFS